MGYIPQCHLRPLIRSNQKSIEFSIATAQLNAPKSLGFALLAMTEIGFLQEQ